MLTFKGKPVRDFLNLSNSVSSQEAKLIAALLIMEHGVTFDDRTSSYSIRSAIFKKGGFGNVVLDTLPRPIGVKAGRITTLPDALYSKQVKSSLAKIESKYNIQIDSVVRWTGDDANEMYIYAGFENFEAFLVYIRKRLVLPGSLSNTKELDAQLVTYSGNAPSYVKNIRSLMSQLNVVVL